MQTWRIVVVIQNWLVFLPDRRSIANGRTTNIQVPSSLPLNDLLTPAIAPSSSFQHSQYPYIPNTCPAEQNKPPRRTQALNSSSAANIDIRTSRSPNQPNPNSSFLVPYSISRARKESSTHSANPRTASYTPAMVAKCRRGQNIRPRHPKMMEVETLATSHQPQTAVSHGTRPPAYFIRRNKSP